MNETFYNKHNQNTTHSLSLSSCDSGNSYSTEIDITVGDSSWQVEQPRRKTLQVKYITGMIQ